MSQQGINPELIVTLGPSSLEPAILKKIAARGVNYVRLNLSHTPLDQIESTIAHVRNTIDVDLILDTEGPQIRTGPLIDGERLLATGQEVLLVETEELKESNSIPLRPRATLNQLTIGDILHLDFGGAVLRVDEIDYSPETPILKCCVVSGGKVGSNKAVTVQDQHFELPSLSDKDCIAIEIAKRHGIRTFTLSFTNSAEDIEQFKRHYPQGTAIAKIESRSGVLQLNSICGVADAILIDRGDLSREIPIERIPFVQKHIIKTARICGLPLYVATNLLDTMMTELRPSRAEVSDITNLILDGATGLVLAAETAVGKHPVETVNLISTLASEADLILAHLDDGDHSEYLRALTNPLSAALIEPHGGSLVNQICTDQSTRDSTHTLPRLSIDAEECMDVEQIAIGTYSPLRGFLGEEDLYSVLNDMRLKDGTAWPMPIILQRHAEQISHLRIGSKVLLEDSSKNQIAVLDLESIFEIDLRRAAQQWFGTTDETHPGVERLLRRGNCVLGGKIHLLSRSTNNHKQFELTPAQTRKIFEARGWRKVVGFHTRNPIHRAHEFIQRQALEHHQCDGMLIQPVVGPKKSGDFSSATIIDSYLLMKEKFYPSREVLFGTFATYPRYAGPREALFTALCRQNFGCSHFIIGRDHAGVGNFYAADASQQIFQKFPDVKITPICFQTAVYCHGCMQHVFQDSCGHQRDQYRSISGTHVRQMLLSGQQPPTWFMRPEISQHLLNRSAAGLETFVDMPPQNLSERGEVLWFTGLSGSGKSTIADLLEKELVNRGKRTVVLDGDEVRRTYNSDLGFSPDDIKENNLRIAQLSEKYRNDYDYVLVPVIAPFEESRKEARSIISQGYTEIFVDTDLEECARRDPKGLYRKALNYEINNFIGLSENTPYETPQRPDIHIETIKLSPQQAVDKILAELSLGEDGRFKEM